jgi:hypothetical protein
MEKQRAAPFDVLESAAPRREMLAGPRGRASWLNEMLQANDGCRKVEGDKLAPLISSRPATGHTLGGTG